MNPIPFIIIGASAAGVLTFFYKRGKTLREQPITYEQFVEQLGRQIDQYMLNEEKKKGVTMYGGECEISISPTEPETVSMKIVLFGRTAKDSEKWSKSEITQKLSVADFTNDLETVSRLEELKKHPDKFKITRPEKE